MTRLLSLVALVAISATSRISPGAARGRAEARSLRSTQQCVGDCQFWQQHAIGGSAFEASLNDAWLESRCSSEALHAVSRTAASKQSASLQT
jgi:hypothetical protein